MPPDTMRAVVLKKPYEIVVEDKPYPKLVHPTDAIIKVTSTALCGSDLHFYRGHLKVPPDVICGHEFIGNIVEKGDAVKNFQVGDHVVVPFCTSCQACYFCERGQASRCAKGEVFGNPSLANTLDGGQAEYVRVPLADTTCLEAPKDLPEDVLVLMTDIFPTGYFGASRFLKDISARDRDEFTVAVVGCGPVGICAITCALTMVRTVYAIDGVEERLKNAAQIGAIPVALSGDPVQTIRKATDGRGADVVIEVVGAVDAFELAFELVRVFGQISCIGLHAGDLPVSGLKCYGKNVTMAFGRSPVRSVWHEALEVLRKEQDKVRFLCGRKMSLEDAAEAYKQFEARKVHKVVFRPAEEKQRED